MFFTEKPETTSCFVGLCTKSANPAWYNAAVNLFMYLFCVFYVTPIGNIE